MFKKEEAVYEVILTKARAQGFNGFAGNCGQAAVAINRTIFLDKANLVGAFNTTFFKKCKNARGHVAVQLCPKGPYLDADGYFKDIDDIEHWGMLDEHDSTLKSQAKRNKVTLTQSDYDNISLLQFDDAEDLFSNTSFDSSKIEWFIHILQTVLETLTKEEQEAIASLQSYAYKISIP
jgi:hypothetical protein